MSVQMSGESAAPVRDAESDAAASAGARLRDARMAAGLSIDAVAQQLKLAPRQVQALEDDDFAQLPGRTFVRGFMRNYARLVAAGSRCGARDAARSRNGALARPSVARRRRRASWASCRPICTTSQARHAGPSRSRWSRSSRSPSSTSLGGRWPNAASRRSRTGAPPPRARHAAPAADDIRHRGGRWRRGHRRRSAAFRHDDRRLPRRRPRRHSCSCFAERRGSK